MTPQEFDALFAEPASGTPEPATSAHSPEYLEALNAAFAQPGAATQQPTRAHTPEEIAAANALFDDPSAPAPTSAPPPALPEAPGIFSRIGSDIGTGVTELPRAIGKGVRNAAQETLNFAVDAGNYVGSGMDALVTSVGGAPGKDVKAPTLPDLAAPKSTTGTLAVGVSQFIAGMIGLGKLSRPLEAASGLAKAGRVAKVGVETAKAATVGAVAFDPYGPRLSDLIESIPGASNPVSRYLKSAPFDTAAEGRIKNALESIGMDAALVGGVLASTRLYKSMSDFRAGKATQADVDSALAQAEAHQAEDAARTQTTAPEGTAAPAPAEPPAPRDVLDLSAPVPVKRDVLDLASPAAPRDTLDLTAAPAPKPSGIIEITPEQTQSLLKTMEADAAALSANGGWRGAVDAGHTFGQGERVPWQKMALEETADGDGLGAFIARLSDEASSGLTVAQGGDVLKDAKVREIVSLRARMWGEDPYALAGALSRAGAAGRDMAVNLQTGFVVANRAMQDTYALAARIRAGDLTEFGGDSAAAAEGLRQMLSVSSTLFGYANAMKTGAGRSLRLMRSEFAPTPEVLEQWRTLDPETLINAVLKTDADPRSLRMLANPNLLEKLRDGLHYSFVNGLLWSPRTHFVNFLSNTVMIGMRPAERMIGSGIINAFTGGSASSTYREAQKQYAYLGTSLSDAFREAAEAWSRGDSVLAPHATENFRQNLNAATIAFKTPDNISNVLWNALAVPAMKLTGLPTRALGAADEFFKQVTYRSKVQARAFVEAEERGLTGPEMADYIRDRLHAAFDDTGRATDLEAVREAQIATFSQDLLPGTVGKTLQNSLAQHPTGRFVLPFLRTPLNAIRMGVKLTPGLNVLQGEYRAMVSGSMGKEAQAQAIGQATMGSLFLGMAAFAASSGAITGGGPSDPKLKAALMATGWQPYSFVTQNPDGSRTYTNYGRYDPVAMPFGIVADIVDALSQADPEDGVPHQIGDVTVAALIGIVKQVGQKSYLKSANDVLEAVMAPDRSGERVAGSFAANLVPFSSGLRFVNPDASLKEARDMADRMLASVPGLSATIPPKRDMWGDPITVNKGLWVNGDKSMVDAEVRRMILEGGVSMGPPNPTIDGVDLRDITLKDGRNAYDAYQTLSALPAPRARPLKQLVANIMKTPAYKRAPDGEAGTRGTKLAMLTGVVSKYRNVALRKVKADPEVRKAMAEKSNAVRDHYKASPAAKQQAPQRQLEALGKKMGVDLSGFGMGQ